VDRIGRSFDRKALAVDNGEPQNCIVFARKGRALHARRSGPLRRPKNLVPAAAAQLHAAFARIESAWRDSAHGHD
jgi:hypothetical protein